MASDFASRWNTLTFLPCYCSHWTHPVQRCKITASARVRTLRKVQSTPVRICAQGERISQSLPSAYLSHEHVLRNLAKVSLLFDANSFSKKNDPYIALVTSHTRSVQAYLRGMAHSLHGHVNMFRRGINVFLSWELRQDSAQSPDVCIWK